MKLKSKKKTFLFNFKINQLLALKIYFFSSIFLILLISVLFFNTGYWDRNKKNLISLAHLNGIINYKYFPEIIIYKFNSLFVNQKKIYLNINQKNTYKLEQNRHKILKNIDLKSVSNRAHQEFVEVSGSITLNDKNLRGDIRLKGDRKIHFQSKENSSYKLNLKKDNYFDQMKKFSLQKPRIRNYLHEWIFHELLGEGNLIKINYDFYDFYLNGEYQGYYNLEEGFGKTLIERNNRRNGPIFSIFEEIKEASEDQKFELYNKNYWAKKENIQVAQKAVQNLNNFLSGNVSAEKVFDINKWAWFFAVVDLTYTYHGAVLKSVKFYFNPINEKIEPIGYDGHRLLPNFNKSILPYKPNLNKTIFDLANENDSYKWLKNFFFQNKKINKEFYKEYIKSVKTISGKSFLDNFFKKRKKEIGRINAGIYTDDYIYDYDAARESGIGIYYYDKKDIYRRAEFLLDKIKINKTKLFVELNYNELKISSFDKNNIVLTNPTLICDAENLKFKNIDLSNTQINLSIKDKKIFHNCDKISFIDEINNFEYIHEINKYNNFKNLNNFFNINNYKEYFNEHKNNVLMLKKNILEFKESVYIPKNYKVKISPSQKIILLNGATIYSNSPWEAIGDETNKILIAGRSNNYGGGLIITDTNEKSVFNYVDFEYLDGFKKNPHIGGIIMGAVNFNNTQVLLKNIFVNNIDTEDSINIFNSRFDIENCYFSNIFSDAIDFDFSEGKAKNIEFNSIGNDALDFSGSKAIIEDILFNRIGDKVVSVGENSRVKIFNLVGKNSLIGVASKDGSNTYVENIKFFNVDYPFAAYKKKEVYEHGKLDLNNFSVKGFKKQYIRDFNSIIFDEKLNKKLGISDKEINEIIKNII
tara:strand:+ start:827 stop:3433 length:2607 start_codon:yes stop_codon:yes gene_type:complete